MMIRFLGYWRAIMQGYNKLQSVLQSALQSVTVCSIHVQ